MRFKVTVMKRPLLVLATLGLIASSAGLAKAGPSVTYQANNFQASKLGNDGYPSNYDMLGLTGQNGHLSLTLNTPVVVPIADLSFTSGYSSYAVVTQYFNTDESPFWKLTVDGVTQAVNLGFSVNSNYTVDTLAMNASAPLTFPGPIPNTLVSFQTQALTWYAFLDTTTTELDGEFILLPTPEPSTLSVCLVTSLIGLSLARRPRIVQGR
jgi:hypothetical protein